MSTVSTSDVARAPSDDVSVEPSTAGRDSRWAFAAVATVVVLALVPLLFEPRFYFADDTQAGAYPIWVQLGGHLLQGELPFFEPSRWMAGNYVAEGQWGLFNPVVWLIGLFAASVGDAILVSTVVKIAFLAISSGGVYLLVRSYRGSRPWSAVVAVLVPFTGFTLYIDAASWVTALFVWALLPWVWWGLRRTLLARGNPVVPFVLGYVLITVGYVHGTLMLCVVIAATLLDGVLARRWRDVLRVLGVGALLGLVALAVYLPGVLTAPVTVRGDDSVFNTNFMSPDLSGLATAGTPLAQPWLTGFWSVPVSAPLMYVAWVVPLVVLVSPSRARPLWRSLSGLLAVGATAAFLAFGPSDMGPLRFPGRVLPYLSLVLLVLLGVLLSRASVKPSRGRLVGALVLVAVGAAFAWFESPGWWKVIGLGAVLAGAGVVLVLRLLARDGRGWSLVGVVILGTLLVTTAQHFFFPRSPLPDFGLPASRSDYTHALPGVDGDVLVVGKPTFDGEWWRSTLYANAWYLNDANVVNVYSPIAHRAFSEELCMDAHGVVCWEVFDTLFEEDPTTGRSVLDLLSVNAVQVLARPGAPKEGQADPYENASPPVGWTEVTRDETSAVWVREEPVAGAGGVVWSDPGIVLSSVETDSRSVSFQVDEVPADGGQVVLSRLDWPGYDVVGATQGESLRGYLLTIDVPAASEGKTVSVTFTPPAWNACLAALAIALVGATAWGVTSAVTRRRRGPTVDAVEAGGSSVSRPG
ncbi:hypothetical protein [Cellulosimicrobium sp. 22601]|uniref:hypothetical protein n=1 Tax=unclassified Cellulosimicrobium TaxID=2624466 RepID=UPI003F842922